MDDRSREWIRAIARPFYWKGEVALGDLLKMLLALVGVFWTLLAFYSKPDVTIYDYDGIGFFRYDNSESAGQPQLIPRAIVLTGFKIRSIFETSAILVGQTITIELDDCKYIQIWMENIEDAGGNNYNFQVRKTTTGYFQEITSKNSFRLEGYFGPSKLQKKTANAKCGSLDFAPLWGEFTDIFKASSQVSMEIVSFFKGASRDSYTRRCKELAKTNRVLKRDMVYFGVTCRWS